MIMRDALYNGKKSIEMTELPTPEAGENDIVVCFSDCDIDRNGKHSSA